MQLSEKFAKRDDLSVWLKWKLEIEHRIQANPRIRAAYRRFFLLPQWVHNGLLFVWLLSVILPLVAICVCEIAAEKMLGSDDDGSTRRDGLGLALFIILTFSVACIVSFGWIFALMAVQFAAVTWFFLAVMNEYERELEQELRNSNRIVK